MLRLPRYLPRNLRYASTAAATSSSSSAKFAPLAMKAAEEVSSKWKGTTANGGKTMNYIGGEFVESSAKKWLEVRDPVCHRCRRDVHRLMISLPRLWLTRYPKPLRRSLMQLSMLLLKPTRLGRRPPFSGGSKSCSSKSAFLRSCSELMSDCNT